MKCYKDFQNDRLCDLCRKIDENCYNGCKGFSQQSSTSNEARTQESVCTNEVPEKRVTLEDELWQMKQNCPYVTESYHDYYKYNACLFHGREGLHLPECKPTEACLVARDKLREKLEKEKCCKHVFDNGESAIEYDSYYEMRSSQMHCRICGKSGSETELKEDRERLEREEKAHLAEESRGVYERRGLNVK